MNTLSNFFRTEMMFWIAWIIIPIIMEIIPTIGNFFVLLKRRICDKNIPKVSVFPEITVIVPVYNSEATLMKCIESIYNSDYPNEKIDVILANNQTKDNSFEVFCECQNLFKDLRINWINASQGKSKALNEALFNSTGVYVIHIDSDGVLEESALKNIVSYFENHPKIHCVTGTVLTNPELIDETDNFFLRLFQKMEFGEYCQAFLSGRNFQSELNSMFTVSGAFSGFRRSAIMKSELYNFDTLCEDTHVTFQIRDKMNKRVALASDAFFFVDPIESANKLYVQRQRWQIGELEVLHMFRDDSKMKIARNYWKDFVIRLIVFDHTFAFPRMIWYFALIALAMINYPLRLIFISILLLFILYSFANLLLYFCIILFLKNFKSLRRYYARKWYLIILLPVFNFVTFWFRFAGIINSMYYENRSWSTRNFKQEFGDIKEVLKKDFFVFDRVLSKIRRVVNNDEE